MMTPIKTRSWNRQPIGFTLFEVLTTLVLTSLILVVVMGLAGKLSSTNRKLLEQPIHEPWVSRLASQLQSDFSNCRFVAQAGHGIEFSLAYSTPVSPKFSMPDPDGYVDDHVPVKIVYAVEQDDQESPVLIRKEVRLDLTPPDHESIDRVANDIAEIRIVQRIDTNVAPPILQLEILRLDRSDPIRLNLVRFGGDRHGR